MGEAIAVPNHTIITTAIRRLNFRYGEVNGVTHHVGNAVAMVSRFTVIQLADEYPSR